MGLEQMPQSGQEVPEVPPAQAMSFETWKEDLIKRAEEFAAKEKNYPSPDGTSGLGEKYQSEPLPSDSLSERGEFPRETSGDDEQRLRGLGRSAAEMIFRGEFPDFGLVMEMNAVSQRLGVEKTRQIGQDIGNEMLGKMTPEEILKAKEMKDRMEPELYRRYGSSDTSVSSRYAGAVSREESAVEKDPKPALERMAETIKAISENYVRLRELKSYLDFIKKSDEQVIKEHAADQAKWRGVYETVRKEFDAQGGTPQEKRYREALEYDKKLRAELDDVSEELEGLGYGFIARESKRSLEYLTPLE